jgi:flavin reductase (DIM6/NTAB) family NADH-FMN oxidoreductase RutF
VERTFETVKMADLSPAEAYDLLTAAVSPRPIAVVTTIDEFGQVNLAPFSFFMMGGSSPASLLFSAIENPDGTQKATLKNVIATEQFVVNTVHREMFAGMTQAAVPGEAMEKWSRSGLTQLPSLAVRPPRIGESLIQFECKLFQVLEHGTGPGSARYVIGEVLYAHVAPEIVANGRIDVELVHLVARMGGKTYVDTGTLERFRGE